MTDNKSLDILGVKGISDSMKIATQGLVDGASAFLSRLCLPAAEELGLALRDRISVWRAKNTLQMLNAANTIYTTQASHRANDRLHPRLVHIAIQEASWTDDTHIQSMWGGLLAASASSEGDSDENLLFMNLLKLLTALEVKMLTIAVERAHKITTPAGLILAQYAVGPPVPDLSELFGTQDLQRIDRELDHLRELGLIAGGIDISANSLSGQFKTGHLWTPQIRPFPAPETGVDLYCTAPCVRKVVWTLVRQLRGPHFSTCA